MGKVVLLPHNEEGYNELTECLEEHQVATLNRATGTGKSFIGLKYAYEHRDKRILIIAPTYPILDQWTEDHMEELGISKKEFTKLDTMIYSNLLKIDDMEELASQYDVVIFDEYHRCGSQKWGKKARELKEAMIKDPDKRVIGLTATEIRYLDNNRNMKDILFDGVEASRLTLADAILNGILPAPYYINLDLEILDEITALIRRVSNGLPSYCTEKNLIITELINIRNEFKKVLFENEDIRQFVKAGEKYLVFSSSKENIKVDSEWIKDFFDDIEIEEYVVHSGQKKEENKSILDKFRKIKSKAASILYSIAILSEGVHVKDVYGIFMRRKTTSPIVYFQQLGRLLSFSRRKDRVVIFDLVGNIKNHKVIYSLYDEVITRAKELMVTDPDNSERYVNIINNFKILDKSTELLKRLEEINTTYSREKLIKLRLISGIELLESGKNVPYITLYAIESDIRRYYKYINIDLFRRIKKLKNLDKPELFELTEEEFKKSLKGYENIYDLLHRKYKISFDNVKKYIDNNYEIPSIFSEDEEEQQLALELYNNFPKYSTSQKKFINSSLDEQDSLYERISYGEYIDDIDFDELIEEINYVIKLQLIVSKNVINYLKVCVIKRKCDNVKKISKIINKLEKYNKTILLSHLDDDLEEQNFSELVDTIPGESNSKMQELIEMLGKKIETYGFEKVLEEEYKRIEKYIKRYGSLPTYKREKSFSDAENNLSNELYFTLKILEKAFDTYGYMDKIDNLVLKVELEATDKIVDKIIDFIVSNDGLLPSKRSKDIYEYTLANYLSRIIRKNNPEMMNRLKPYLDGFDSKLKEIIIRSENIDDKDFDEKELEKLIKKYERHFKSSEISEIRSNIRLKKIINFMLSHNYELPSKHAQDLEEKFLARIYSYIKNNLTPKQFNILGKYLSKQEEYKQKFIVKYTEYIEKTGVIPRLFSSGEEYELACSYMRWEPYIDKDVLKKIRNNSIIKGLIKFMEEHNYEMPSQKNSDGYERSLAYFYSLIKRYLDDNEKKTLNVYIQKMMEKKSEFIEKYLNFIKVNGRTPTSTDNKELFESFNRWLPFLSLREKNLLKCNEKEKIFEKFLLEHNYEIPSIKNPDPNEQAVARSYTYNREFFDVILDKYKEQIEKSKQDFIIRYSTFVNTNKRVPLIKMENERELIYSYNRWQPFLTIEELDKLKIKTASKFDALANAYNAIKKKK